jgi:GTP-binding protein
MTRPPVITDEAPARFHVVLVGRPNVGKSALFNRLAGSRRALVHDRPGMTRDVLEVNARTGSGRSYRIVDTGGLDLDAAGGFAAWTSDRALAAVADASLLIFVLDGVAGLLPEDQRLGKTLRALGKPVIVAWNKADTREAQQREGEATALGFDPVITVSALHGIGADDLDDAIEAYLPVDLDPETRINPLPITIIGRPNVGKSSLVNALSGRDKVMVSEIAGTTRDAIDVTLEREGRHYLLVDTAGIRRKGKTEDPAEKLSIVAARHAMERAKIAIVVFDASEGVTAQDAHITGYAEEAGRGILLVANKWDLIEDDHARVKALRDEVADRFAFAKGAPFLPVSCKTGKSVGRILPEADALAKRFATQLSTGELNRLLQKAFEAQTPRAKSGRTLRIRYAVQVASNPPLIRLFADRAEPLHFSFERYLQNRIREKWKLAGVPLKFVVKPGS